MGLESKTSHWKAGRPRKLEPSLLIVKKQSGRVLFLFHWIIIKKYVS